MKWKTLTAHYFQENVEREESIEIGARPIALDIYRILAPHVELTERAIPSLCKVVQIAVDLEAEFSLQRARFTVFDQFEHKRNGLRFDPEIMQLDVREPGLLEGCVYNVSVVVSPALVAYSGPVGDDYNKRIVVAKAVVLIDPIPASPAPSTPDSEFLGPWFSARQQAAAKKAQSNTREPAPISEQSNAPRPEGKRTSDYDTREDAAAQKRMRTKQSLGRRLLNYIRSPASGHGVGTPKNRQRRLLL